MARWTIRRAAATLVALCVTCAGMGQQMRAQPLTPESIQRLYKQYIQQLQLENAKIADRQAAFGESAYDQTKDAIKELIQVIKFSNPSEDAPDLKDWSEFANKLGELVAWSTKTLDDIGNSTNELGALEARLGTLNQRLAESIVAVKAKVDALKAADHAIRNPKITLLPLPMPHEPDWTALDQAIENMRKEDQPFLTAIDPCSSLGDANQQASKGVDGCLNCSNFNYRTNLKIAKLNKCMQDAIACDNRCDPNHYLNGCYVACMHASEACTAAADSCP